MKFEIFLKLNNIIKNTFCYLSRRKKYEIFISFLLPEKFEKIIDIGVDDVREKDNYTNFLEKFYPFKSNITAIGITDGKNFKKVFPEIKYVKADGRNLPFTENQFDIAFSNAVLEHVGEGNYNEQKRFVNEVVRVSKRGIIMTPYKYFLIEPHTLIPFLFCFPKKIREKIIRRRFSLSWNLLSMQEFHNLFPSYLELKIIKQKILFFTINLIVVYEKIHI